jgi:pimeloyl-ACP methyl ester carboxylesterase
MHCLRDDLAPARTAPYTVVMLPAAFCTPEDFIREGFVRAVRARALPLDLVFVQPQADHVADRRALQWLHQELVLPARAGGSAVWLGGISLGGYLALCYAASHASALTGLCLLAPYLGSHVVTGEIERAGGLKGWQAPVDADEEQRLWHFIQRRDAQRLTLHLGLGRDDRFAARHQVLARALPPSEVDSEPGGHDWPTWHRLWENFLMRQFATP